MHRRIDKAFSKFKGEARCEIVPNRCPAEVNDSWPDLDVNTYKSSDNLDYHGCRGITCEECWDCEIE